ncbi:transposase family protein, partial [Pseudaminobacter arsenicus]
ISAMERRFGSTRLVPAGFVVEHAEMSTDCVFLDVRAAAISATCPCCGTASRRTQSRYVRKVADLPISGRRVILRVTVRRFWCDAVLCRRRIFAERFGDTVLAPLSRRTGRLET